MPYHDKTQLVRVAIADDHNMVRQVFKDHLNQHPKFKVVAEAEDGGKLLKLLLHQHIVIDVLLLDLLSPKMDGREALKLIAKDHPSIRILIFSACNDPNIIRETFELGAYGFVSKAAEPEELHEAILSAANGRIYKNEVYHLYQHLKLTPTEVQVLKLIWMEKTNEEIARIMCISLSTIEKIKHQLKEKSNTKTTVGLIKYALERKILIPGH